MILLDPVGTKAPSIPFKETKIWAKAFVDEDHNIQCNSQGFPVPTFRYLCSMIFILFFFCAIFVIFNFVFPIYSQK